MSWPLLVGLVIALGLALLATVWRRMELSQMARTVKERERAERQGAAEAQLQHPVIDLSRCLGCGTCVAVCPEDGVLDLVHGQALVVNGARCQGISACERECPVGAITVTLSNLETRADIPALREDLEAVGSPGLFLAGEVTAHALIRTAIDHGSAVAEEIARRVANEEPPHDDAMDLVIVGAGPAGLACALEATRHGLDFLVVEQEHGVGGTVAKYPRRKLVLTQPVEMPLVGRMRRNSYTKEELMEIWGSIAEQHELPIAGGQVFTGVEPEPDGGFSVHTETDVFRARYVCLALGRRGVPRRLGVPGEDLPKVAYSLLDAHSYQNLRIMVVGGGDSAVETALGLAEQAGNQVTLSYRKESFFRVRARNEERLELCLGEGRLRVVFQSEVRAIHPDSVDLAVRNGEGHRVVRVPNDEVFIMAGGVPPFELLERSGVSFDAEHRPPQDPVREQGTGLIRALSAALVLALITLGYALWHSDYYTLSTAERPTHDKHAFLRPGMGIGLGLGIASVVMIVANLAYLLRRSPAIKFRLGSLQLWMTSHVATGILALLLAMLHGAMSPRDTPGGHAFWALAVLLVTGAIGRYFYSYVPRAANGRELELAEFKNRLGRMSEEWDQGRSSSASPRARRSKRCSRKSAGAAASSRVYSVCSESASVCGACSRALPKTVRSRASRLSRSPTPSRSHGAPTARR